MKRKILNTDVDFRGYDELKSLILGKISSREKLTVTYANSHVCVTALNNSELSGCLGGFDVVHPDGIAVYAAHKFLYRPGKNARRVNGTDLYNLLFTEGGFSCFIIGGPEDAEGRIKNKFSKVNVRGHLYKLAGSSVVESVNKSGADILFVALGTPVQEKWIIENKDALKVPVIIATGSGIDIVSGKKHRAPAFMRKAGLEWLFRLFSEPRRLWKRYLIMNPVFIFKVIGQKLKLNLKQGNT